MRNPELMEMKKCPPRPRGYDETWVSHVVHHVNMIAIVNDD
jgi:hypothetical protein